MDGQMKYSFISEVITGLYSQILMFHILIKGEVIQCVLNRFSQIYTYVNTKSEDLLYKLLSQPSMPVMFHFLNKLFKYKMYDSLSISFKQI